MISNIDDFTSGTIRHDNCSRFLFILIAIGCDAELRIEFGENNKDIKLMSLGGKKFEDNNKTLLK